MWIKFTRSGSKNRGTRLKAQVAKSFRCNSSRQPRCRVLLHLGTIGLQDLGDPKARLMFWLSVERSLEKSGNRFSDSEKALIRSLIEKRVPRPRIAASGLPLSV
ncbi:MAG TPA: hypothetical protein VF648_09775 [Pyrinomonadaceae bacterium]